MSSKVLKTKSALDITAPAEEKKPNKLEEKLDAVLDGVTELIRAVGELNKKITELPSGDNLKRLARAGRM